MSIQKSTSIQVKRSELYLLVGTIQRLGIICIVRDLRIYVYVQVPFLKVFSSVHSYQHLFC